MNSETVWQGLVIALLLKIIWDWLKAGRIKQGVYLEKVEFERRETDYIKKAEEKNFMKQIDFDTHTKECGAIKLRTEISQAMNETIQARTNCRAWMINMEQGIKQRKDYYEKRLEHGDAQFEKIMEDIGGIKTSIAVMASSMKDLVKQIEKRTI